MLEFSEMISQMLNINIVTKYEISTNLLSIISNIANSSFFNHNRTEEQNKLDIV